jgi:hypothetical protein
MVAVQRDGRYVAMLYGGEHDKEDFDGDTWILEGNVEGGGGKGGVSVLLGVCGKALFVILSCMFLKHGGGWYRRLLHAWQ